MVEKLADMLTALFGEPPSARDQVRQHRRTIDKAIRTLERERLRASEGAKQHAPKVRAAVMRGETAQARVFAKETVRARRQVEQLDGMKQRLSGLSVRIQTIGATQTLGTVMQGVTKAVKAMGEDIGTAAVAQTMKTFERELASLDMADEMLGDTLDDALDTLEDDEGADELVNQILDEESMVVEIAMPAVPSGTSTRPPYDQPADADSLSERLHNLRDGPR